MMRLGVVWGEAKLLLGGAYECELVLFFLLSVVTRPSVLPVPCVPADPATNPRGPVGGRNRVSWGAFELRTLILHGEP